MMFSEANEIWIYNFLAYDVFCEYDARLWIRKIHIIGTQLIPSYDDFSEVDVI